jgi:hypothetical protein
LRADDDGDDNCCTCSVAAADCKAL